MRRGIILERDFERIKEAYLRRPGKLREAPPMESEKPRASALRMKKFRARRRKSIRLLTIEVLPADCAYLYCAGFLQEPETIDEHLPLAIRRLLDSIR
jgi:hypothetical protein